MESVERSISMEGEVTLNAETPFVGMVVPFLAKLVLKLLGQVKASHQGRWLDRRF